METDVARYLTTVENLFTYQPDGEVRLLFEHGAAMPDPDGVLEGEGTQTRYVVVRELDAALVARYVQQAIAQRLLR